MIAKNNDEIFYTVWYHCIYIHFTQQPVGGVNKFTVQQNHTNNNGNK